MDEQLDQSVVSGRGTVRPLGLVYILVAGLLVFGVGVGGYRLGKSNLGLRDSSLVDQTLVGKQKEQKSWGGYNFEPWIDGTVQGFPVERDGKMDIYLLGKGDQDRVEKINLQVKVEGGSFAANLGQDSPLVSPDLLKVATIQNGKLVFLSADGKRSLGFPEELEAPFLSGWSPDSSRLIVYSSPRNIKSVLQCDGPGCSEPPEKEYFKAGRWPGGYYLIDLKLGQAIYLEPLTAFHSWVGNHTILSRIYADVGKDDFMVFDVDSFSLNTKEAVGLKPYFGVQVSSSTDGQFWALSLGNVGGSDQVGFGNIVLAIYPQVEGKEIDKGRWAEVQKPVLNASGDKLLYTRRDELPNGDDFVMYFNVPDNKKERLAKGRPVMWVDENRFVYAQRRTGAEYLADYFIYNLKSRTSVRINQD